MKFILTLFTILLSLSLLQGQFSIIGSVTNTVGEKLESASVFLVQTDRMAATDMNGSYTIADIEKGTYRLKCTYVGFENWEELVDVTKDLVIDIELKGTLYQLDEIELKSTWVKKDEPFAYSNVGQDEIERENLGQDVPYILKWTPSTVVTSDAGGGVGYTGMRIRGVDPTRVNVTINGIPLNDSESQGVFWVDLPDFLSSVDQIQIQRGVGVSTNGAGAFGATVNLSTNKTQVNPYLTLNTSYGSFDTKKIGISGGTGLMNGRYTIDGRYSIIQSDGYIDRASSDLKSYYFSAARLSEKSSLRLNLFSGKEITYQAWNGLPQQYLDTLRTYNPSGTKKPGAPHEDEVDNYKQTHLQLLYNRSINDGFKINLGAHYTKGKGYFELYRSGEDLADYGLSSPDTMVSDLIERRWLDNDFYGVIGSAEKLWGESTLTLGGALNYYQGGHFGKIVSTVVDIDIPADFRYYDNDGNKLDANIYLKWNYQLNQQLSTFVDLQYRRVGYEFLGFDNNLNQVDQEVSLSFFNPKLGLFYAINDQLSSFASLSVGNKEPGRNEYTNSTPDSRPLAERLFDYELGLKYTGSNFGIGINGYFMDYKDQLVLTGEINDVGEYIKENVAQSSRAGIELIGEIEILDGLNYSHTSTFSQNRIAAFAEYIDRWDTGLQETVMHENTDLAFSPSVIMGNRIDYNFLDNHGHNASVGLSNKYVGAQYIDNTSSEYSKLDAYNYTDLNITYAIKDVWTEEIRFTFKVNNLLNAKYVNNAWIYRFRSAAYNPVPDDPYARLESNDQYNLTGLFPQAGVNYLLNVAIDF